MMEVKEQKEMIENPVSINNQELKHKIRYSKWAISDSAKLAVKCKHNIIGGLTVVGQVNVPIHRLKHPLNTS